MPLLYIAEKLFIMGEEQSITMLVRRIEPLAKSAILSDCLCKALLDDYCETISKLTGEGEDQIKERVLERSSFHLDNLRKTMGFE